MPDPGRACAGVTDTPRGGIETGVTRVGVEQELYLVGDDCRPAPVATQVLDGIEDARFTTELARFNLEANFGPRPFQGDFLRRMEEDLRDARATANAAAGAHNAHVLLTGILPTLRIEDLCRQNMTPEPRYEHLNDALFHGRDAITVTIDGIEEFEGSFDSVILEGANTSLQLHLQVAPGDAAHLYNLMQLVTAPLMAAAANSPVLLGKRLWHETRVAVFERALDERSGSQLARGRPGRVWFGDAWLKDSIVELFHDNAARFPAILTREMDEDALEVVERGDSPTLAALALHNGTVWRWNRPCYGVHDGVAHLRIENRVLPSGPTVVDEVANAALLYGMMAGLREPYADLAERMPFDDARANFLNAARQGLDAQFRWLDGREFDAWTLLLDELIPAARRGLADVEVPEGDIDRYLGIMEARVETGRTGAAWLLNAFRESPDCEPEAIWHDAVAAMLREQESGRPVHEWDTPRGNGPPPDGEPSVAAIMTTDLFTLRPDDVVDLAISVMEWKHIRHIPVEGEDGELYGVLTARDLLRASQVSRGSGNNEADPLSGAVRKLMRTDIVRVEPGMSLREAMDAMLDSDLGCLLVVSGKRLTGIVTERDLMRAAGEVLSLRQA